jgi:hypothetical protein
MSEGETFSAARENGREHPQNRSRRRTVIARKHGCWPAPGAELLTRALARCFETRHTKLVLAASIQQHVIWGLNAPRPKAERWLTGGR